MNDESSVLSQFVAKKRFLFDLSVSTLENQLFQRHFVTSGQFRNFAGAVQQLRSIMERGIQGQETDWSLQQKRGDSFGIVWEQLLQLMEWIAPPPAAKKVEFQGVYAVCLMIVLAGALKVQSVKDLMKVKQLFDESVWELYVFWKCPSMGV